MVTPKTAEGRNAPRVKVNRPRLTEQQYAVWRLMCRGFGVTDVAERLHLSVKTVEQHCRGARDRISGVSPPPPVRAVMADLLWGKIAELYDKADTRCPHDPDELAGDCIRDSVCDCHMSEILKDKQLP